SEQSATLLGVSVNDRVRFLPDGTGLSTESLIFRAWDQSDGLPTGSTNVNVSTHGGTTPYSNATATVGVRVRDLPVLTLPPDQTFEGDSPQGATVTFAAATATAQMSTPTIAYFVNNSPISNGQYQFSLGATTVTVTATCPGGEQSSGTFQV